LFLIALTGAGDLVEARRHGWALDAFVDLMSGGATVLDVLPQVGVLLAFSAMLLPLASFRLRRSPGA
jgi:hypothetical protein